MIKKTDFDYNLPHNLIAQKPISPRDKARLLLVDKNKKKIYHDNFFNLDKLLKADDLLVINDTKVFKARLFGKKISGGKIEVFLLKKINNNSYSSLLKGKVKEGEKIIISNKLKINIIKKEIDNTYKIKFNLKNKELEVELDKLAKVPIPPYIKKGQADIKDVLNYQTVYANNKQEKSVAAPTAGLHFTKRMIKKLKKRNIKIVKITLHVGLGTFLPVKCENILDHRMHKEELIIKKEEKKQILEAKKEKRRLVAVGTTVCRALESLAKCEKSLKDKQDFKHETDIFIYPGYKFKLTDVLLTNFHLPQSTLLMLVSALAGKRLIKKAYQEAIIKKYRFYSYGDVMHVKSFNYDTETIVDESYNMTP
jgi:S-adenosylmethionine:tRNA ribosyltransferase-isomerase